MNYKIENDFIAIECNGLYIDLHNNLDFVGVEYNVEGRSLILKWIKASGKWVSSMTPAKVNLTFHGVHLFKCKERDSAVPFTEDNCLDFIAFIGNDLVEIMEGGISASPSENFNHLNIIFNSGFAVKIGAETLFMSD